MMEKLNVDVETVRKILELIGDNRDLAAYLYYLIGLKFVESEEFKKAIETIRNDLKAFKEEINTLLDKRFQEQDIQLREFQDTITQQIDQRFQEQDRRIDQRFQEQDRRIDQRFQEQDRRFDRQDIILMEINSKLGANLEQVLASFVERELAAKGFQQVSLKMRAKFKDPNRVVSPHTTEFEVDIYCENPLVIVEVTAFLTNLDKVELFVKKVAEIKKRVPSDVPIGLIALVTYSIDDDLREDTIKLLQDVGAVPIERRQLEA